MKTIWIACFLVCAAPDAGTAKKPEQYFDEAITLKKEKRYDEAKAKLEQCVKLKPEHRPCFGLLASVLVLISKRDDSPRDMEEARKYYERFIDLEQPGPKSKFPPAMGDWAVPEPAP